MAWLAARREAMAKEEKSGGRTETATLPRNLAGAKPRYSYGSKQFDLKFESDLDRAAYITAQPKPSKHDADYVAWLQQQTGLADAEIRAHGQTIRDSIKQQAKNAKPGTLAVPDTKWGKSTKQELAEPESIEKPAPVSREAQIESVLSYLREHAGEPALTDAYKLNRKFNIPHQDMEEALRRRREEVLSKVEAQRKQEQEEQEREDLVQPKSVEKEENPQLEKQEATERAAGNQRINARNTLYHGTEFDGAAGILESGVIDNSRGGAMKGRGQSFSRVPLAGMGPVTFELDRDRMPKHVSVNKLVNKDEFEERTDQPVPASAIRRIWISQAAYDEAQLPPSATDGLWTGIGKQYLPKVLALAKERGIPVTISTQQSLITSRAKGIREPASKPDLASPESLEKQDKPEATAPAAENREAQIESVLSYLREHAGEPGLTDLYKLNQKFNIPEQDLKEALRRRTEEILAKVEAQRLDSGTTPATERRKTERPTALTAPPEPKSTRQDEDAAFDQWHGNELSARDFADTSKEEFDGYRSQLEALAKEAARLGRVMQDDAQPYENRKLASEGVNEAWRQIEKVIRNLESYERVGKMVRNRVADQYGLDLPTWKTEAEYEEEDKAEEERRRIADEAEEAAYDAAQRKAEEQQDLAKPKEIEALPAPNTDRRTPEQIVWDAMQKLDRGGDIFVGELREEARLDKPTFDAAITALSHQRKIQLSRTDDPFHVSSRDALLYVPTEDGKTYYVAASLLPGAQRPTASSNSYKYELKIQGEGDKWHGNQVAFATREEADSAGLSKFQNWMTATDYRVVESDEKPNYRWDKDHGPVSIQSKPDLASPESLEKQETPVTTPAPLADTIIEANAVHKPNGAIDSPTLAGELPQGNSGTRSGGRTRSGGGTRSGSGSGRARKGRGGQPQLASGDRTGDTNNGSPTERAEEQLTKDLPPRGASTTPTHLDHDYRIADGRIISGTPEKRARDNIAAIELLRDLQKNDRDATVAEKEILAAFVGWGNVPQLFAGATPEWKAQQTKLKSLLSGEEYRDAEQSTINAHYTSDAIIDTIWRSMLFLGAKPGMSWLEPAIGVGNFFGRQPEALLQGARRVGIEKDAITAGIAKFLYPDSGIDHKAFENAELPENYFDGTVSNVPFGKAGVHDPAWRDKKYLTTPIHNYFFAKSLENLRPGGVMAFITSRYTMDGYASEHSAFRKWMDERADLLGAVRLPSNAFMQSSGTHVITDILFLRKRLPGAERAGADWLNTKPKSLTGDYITAPVQINQYYHKHPENVLGEQKLKRGQFTNSDYNVEGKLDPDALQASLFRALPQDGGFQQWTSGKKSNRVALRDLKGAEAKKIGNLFFDEKGQLYRRTTAGSAEPVEANAQFKARVKGQLKIRDALVQLQAAELGKAAPEAVLNSLRVALNRAYDAYVKEYGALWGRDNQKAMYGDPDAPLLIGALEREFDGKRTAKKAPLFEKRQLPADEPITRADSGLNAMLVSLNETGRLDWDRMSALTGKTPAELQQELNGSRVFLDPATRTWQTAEEYLSGAVRSKLKQAVAKLEPQFTTNVAALKNAQPEDIPVGEIDALLGVTWVPLDTYSQFVQHILNTDAECKVTHVGDRWQITGAPDPKTKWDTARVKGLELLQESFNMKRIKVEDWNAETKRMLVNRTETVAAQARQAEIQKEFQRWLFADPERGRATARIYNDIHNDTRRRTFDGSHLTFPGMSRIPLRNGKDLEPHQKNGVWRMIVQPNVLLAHWVGTGKTFGLIAAGMELKRLGLIKRPMYVVPNSTLGGWRKQFNALYPQKRVLIFSETDLKPDRRKQVMAQIATSDWDAVVIPESSFGLLRTGDEIFMQQYRLLEAQLRKQMMEAEGAGIDPRQIKRIASANDKLLTNLLAKRNAERQDNTVTWEQLGIDQLFVDEAHHYKKLGYTTKQVNVAGIEPNNNQKTFDLIIKMRHVQKHGRGVVFATATPVTNTIGELYNMMNYLIPQELAARGLGTFDEWAANYGRTVPVFEKKPEGGGYQVKARFSEFVNATDLQELFSSFADVVTSADAKVPAPAIHGGQRKSLINRMNPDQQEILEEFMARGAAIRANPGEALPDNMAALYGDASALGIDARIFRSGAKDYPDNRINKAADVAYSDWLESTPTRGTIIIFADQGKPASEKKVGKSPRRTSFSIYDELIKKLVERGIPRDEIAHIYQAKTQIRRTQLFQKVSNGEIRVLIGSRGKMGEGVNIQERGYAIQHLDVPHRPTDLDQSEGRFLRPGNIHKEVKIYYHVTEGSLDELRFQNAARKAKFLNQFLAGKTSGRRIEDVTDLQPSLDLFTAQASGDPRVLRKLEVDQEVDRLSYLHSAWRSQQFDKTNDLRAIPIKIADAERELARARKDIAASGKAGRVFEVAGNKYEGEGISKSAGAAIYAEILKAREKQTEKGASFYSIGKAFGLELETEGSTLYIGEAPSTLDVRGVGYADGIVQRLSYAIKTALPGHIQLLEKQIANFRKELATVQSTVNETWPHEAEYDKLKREQQGLFEALSGKGDQSAAAVDDGQEIQDDSVEAAEDAGEDEDEDADTTPSEIATPKPKGSNSVTLGSGLGALQEPLVQLYQQDLLPTAKTVTRTLLGALDDIQKLLAPQTRGEPARKGYGLLREMGAELDQRRDRAVAALQAFRQHFNGYAIEHGVHGLRVYTAIETGRTSGLSPVDQAFARVARALLDSRKTELQKLDLVHHYIDNYLPHEYKKPDAAARWIQNWQSKRPMAGSEDFRKQRTYPTMQDALEDPDFTLEAKFDNPVDFVLSKLGQMDKSIIAHYAFEELHGEGRLLYATSPHKVPLGKEAIDDKIFKVAGPQRGAVEINPAKQEPKPERADFANPQAFTDALNDWSDTTVQPEDVHVFGRREMGRYYADEPLAYIINSQLAPGISHTDSYGMLRSIGNTMNLLELGVSYYHGLTTTLNSTFSDLALGAKQIAAGKPIEGLASIARSPGAVVDDYLKGTKLQAVWDGTAVNPDPMLVAICDAMKRGGGKARMDAYYATDFTQGMIKSWQRKGNPIGSAVGAAWRAPFALMEQMFTKPLMEKLVPRVKMGVFLKRAMLELQMRPDMGLDEARERFGKIWDAMDDRFGQLSQRNLMLNPTVRDIMNVTVGRPGWQLGTARAVGGGGFDTLKFAADMAKWAGTGGRSAPPEFTDRMAYLWVGLLLGGAIINGLLSWLLSGKPPDELMDYVMPRDGGVTEDGHESRIILPTYLAKDIHSWFTNPAGTAAAKLSPPLAWLAGFLRNEDNQNHHIRGKGGIGLGKYTAGFVIPYSVQGAVKNRERGVSWGKTIAPSVGVMPAGRRVGISKAEEIIAQYQDDNRATIRPVTTQYAHARSQVLIAARSGNLAKARQIGQEAGISPTDMKKTLQRARLTPLVANFKGVRDLDTVLRVYDAATPQERAQIHQIALRKVLSARSKPGDWEDPETGELAEKYFHIRPLSRQPLRDLAAPAELQ